MLHRPWSAAVVCTVAVLCAGLEALTSNVSAQTCTVSGSSVTLTSGTCSIAPNTTLNGSPAVHATTDAQISTNNVTINEFNGGSTGLLAETDGIIIVNSGSLIEGNWATAASALTGGQIIFQPSSVISAPFGGGSTALIANGVNATTGRPSQITASGLTVNLNGAGNNVGARATNGGIINLNDGTTITFTQGGGSNTGLWASGAGSQINTNNVIVNIPLVGGSGGNDTGVRADSGAAVTLNGGSVTVQGNGGGESGLLATGAGSSVTGTDVTVNVTSNGGNARGGVVQNGASVSLTGGSVTTAGGAGSYGFLVQAPAGVTNTLSLNGTTVSSASDAFAVQGGTAVIDTVNATASSNNGILLSAAQNSTVTMTNSHSTLTGAILTDPSSTSDVTLSNGTVWNMTGSSNATNVTNNDSDIIFTAPSSGAFKTLTVTNYTGTGGTITLNTFLGTDNSPTDQVIVNGGTLTGSTSLRIQNTNGPGDLTVANGIPVVVTTNGGTTAVGAFSLASEVRGGAYDYFLWRGGLNGTAPNDWFLRSTFDVPTTTLPASVPPGWVAPPPTVVTPTPTPPGTTPPGTTPPGTTPPGTTPPGTTPPGTTPPGTTSPSPTPPLAVPPNLLPPDPPPAALPPGRYPIIGPAIATYGVAQPIARQLGLMSLGTLDQRIGDTMTSANAGTSGAGIGRSDWIRVFGQHADNRYSAYSDPRAEGLMGGVQGGIDLWRGSVAPGHRDSAGVYFAYATAAMDVDGLVTNALATGYVLARTGTVNLNAYSGGAYWTHYGPEGWYIDAVVQGTYYDGNAATTFAQLPLKGAGFLASLEGGYPVSLPFGPGFVLEPQGQIIWQQVSFDNANDGLGDVDLGTTVGFTGRLGMRGQWTLVGDNGMLWQPYMGFNVWRDWGGQATATYSASDLVPLIEQATRLEVLGGTTVRLDTRFSLYAEAGYQFGISDTNDVRRDTVRGDVGFRYTW